MRKNWHIVTALVLAATAAGCDHRASVSSAGAASPAIDPFALVLDYKWEGNIDRVDLVEPSGMTFHPGRGTLFVVGDEGMIAEMQSDGSPVQVGQLTSADYEGVTCDPATGLLYVVIEGEEAILEIEPDGFKVRRRFQIDRHFEGRLVMSEEGNGVEAIVFVPDADHPESGTFFIANQSFVLDDPEDVSAIFEIELPLRTGGETAHTLRMIPMRVIDLSAMYYEADEDRLLVVSDATNTLFAMTLDGEVRQSWAITGDNQEGLALDPERFMYIAQDSGGVIKIKPRWSADSPTQRR